MNVFFERDPKQQTPDTPALQSAGNSKRQWFFRIVLFALVIVVGWVLYREFSYVYALRATVMGDMVYYRSPDNGYVQEVNVAPGDHVEEGQVVFRLDDKLYTKQRDQLVAWRATTQKEVEAFETCIDEEKANLKEFTHSSRLRLKLLERERDGCKEQIEAFKAIYNRSVRLGAANAASAEEAQIRKAGIDKLMVSLAQMDLQIKMQKQVIEQAEEGRYLVVNSSISTGVGIKPTDIGSSDVATTNSVGVMSIKNPFLDYQIQIAARKSKIEEINVQIVQLNNLIDRCKIRSRTSGAVMHVNKGAGDYANTNDYAVGVETSTERYVVARFTAEDARGLKHGSVCWVITPDGTFEGSVTAIGHSTLGSRGALSADDESSMDEFPVKITLPSDANLRNGVNAFVKVRKNWNLQQWLQRLF